MSDPTVHRTIAVCGYHCSGAEWVHHIISKLLPLNGCNGNTIGRASVSCYPGISPSLMSTAISETCDVPHQLVLVLRNPKDVYAAMYRSLGHETAEQFEHFVSNSLQSSYNNTGSWFDYTLAWDSYLRQTPECNVHIIYFNQLVRDFEGEFCRLCRFLDISVDGNSVAEICSLLCLDGIITDGPRRKRQRIDHTDWKADKTLYEVDLWKHFFMVQYSQTFDMTFRDKMKHSSFDTNGLV